MTIKHYKQIEVLKDNHRFKYILAGRRGGKTKMIVEAIIEAIHQAPEHSDIFYIGPTMQQAYELIWDEMDNRLYELKWKYQPWISKRLFEFTRGRKFYVIGAEKIRRVRGHKVYAAFLDELAFFSTPLKDIWRAVRPSLTDLGGKAWLTTTPDGKGTDAYDFYLEILSKEEDWKYFHWTTQDNPFIPPDEIEAAKRELDEKSFRQEYQAEWESFEGLAYYSFEANLNVKQQDPLSLSYAVDITLDFNVNPTSLLVCQFINGMALIKKEYSLKNSSTIETIKMFIKDHEAIKNSIYIRVFGDAAGNNRSSNTGFADYYYLKQLFNDNNLRYEICVPASNPAIVDRLIHVNSWLKNARNESRIEIDPSAKELIRDLSSQECHGRVPLDNNNLGHKADALGYYINWLQHFNNRKKTGTTIL